jgi:hypothetical protein
MTPTIDEAINLFEQIAHEKNINLDNVDVNWIKLMITGTQICNFKTRKLFIDYVEHSLNRIPQKALIK